jgi:cytidine deaminase
MILIVALVYRESASAQQAIPGPEAGQEMVEAQRPTLTGSDPKPRDAAKAILAAFDRYEVVAMGAPTVIRTSTISFSISSEALSFRARSTTLSWNAAIRYTSLSSTGTLRATICRWTQHGRFGATQRSPCAACRRFMRNSFR